MDESKKWTWRWPIKLTESRIRGVYEHLRSNHKTVEIAACDAIADRETVDLENLINGHIWVQTQWVRFKCTEPNLVLAFQDETRCTAELRWGVDAGESAKVVMEHVKNCFAPLQLLCHTGLFISCARQAL